MPTAHTEVTELGTALGMLAHSPAAALADQPAALRSVGSATWQRFVALASDPRHAALYHDAFDNGAAFLGARDGLRGRPPIIVEWRGPQPAPGHDAAPVDLRVDHVYLVSCKYLSKILRNSSPARLFQGLLGEAAGEPGDWFAVTAPAQFQAYYSSVRTTIDHPLPGLVGELTPADRAVMKPILARHSRPPQCLDAWNELCSAVAIASARSWNDGLNTPSARLRMFCRLLRIGDAPYFVLGQERHDTLRTRIASLLDWHQRFELRSLAAFAKDGGQPMVGWRAVVRERSARGECEISGHVQVRWSHGQFQGVPEAKVYLDSHHGDVPGYYPLV